jgi:hypothetical protein
MKLGWSIAGCALFLTSCANGISTTPSQPTPSPPLFGAPSRSATFNYTGAQQNFIVPAGITRVTISASGAQGGAGFDYTPGSTIGGGSGANGGFVLATLTVTAGETLAVNVGGQGGAGSISIGGAGGFNGGGAGGNEFAGGGGGGASDLRRSGFALANRIVVAGGGGGGGGPFRGACGEESSCSVGGAGGGGGGLVGIAGAGGVGLAVSMTGGNGGTQNAGGAAGVGGFNGVQGNGGGGSTLLAGGGAGGGGYFGGGGGGGDINGGGGGGGGSSFAAPTAMNVTHQQGVRAGNGQVIITW